MSTTALAAMSITGFLVLAPSLHADWQDQAPRAELMDRLQTAYPLTAMNGIKVTKPGTVFVIQQDGIQANPAAIGPFRNKYANGQVGAEGRDLLRRFDPTGGRWGSIGAAVQPRVLVAGEKVYLLKMDVRDDGITMTVQTCGSCDPAAVDPADKPFVASIQFRFTKGFLAATDLNRVQSAIGSLLAFPYTPTAMSAPPVEQRGTAPAYAQTQTPDGESATQPVKFADLTPPERPAGTAPQAQAQAGVTEPASQPFRDLPAPPRPIETKPEIKTEAKPETKPEIDIGWTPNQVRAALGKPGKIDKQQHGRESYIYEKYGHMTVSFENGKVVAIVSGR